MDPLAPLYAVRDGLAAAVAALFPSPPTDLQAALNGTPLNGTLNLRGGSWTGWFSVPRAMTIKGGTIHVPPGGRGLTIVSGVTVDGTELVGTDGHYRDGEFGIYGAGTASVRLTGVALRNVRTSGIGKGAIWLEYAQDPDITGCSVDDTGYAGIMVLSTNGAVIHRNTVRRVGMFGDTPGPENAYGIAVSEQGGPVSTEWEITHNTVEDVPYWHGIDNHSGARGVIARNTVRRCYIAIWCTIGTTPRPQYISILRNSVEDGVSAHGYNTTGIEYGWCDHIWVLGNAISGVDNTIYDYQNSSTDEHVAA